MFRENNGLQKVLTRMDNSLILKPNIVFFYNNAHAIQCIRDTGGRWLQRKWHSLWGYVAKITANTRLELLVILEKILVW